MSKLYSTYLALKQKDSQTVYLFKSGIFFIALDKDAYKLASIFNFKLGQLNDEIVKCGFPCSSIDKYTKLFEYCNIKFQIIDSTNNTMYNARQYAQSEAEKDLLQELSTLDIDNLSIPKAYELLESFKLKATSILNLN